MDLENTFAWVPKATLRELFEQFVVQWMALVRWKTSDQLESRTRMGRSTKHQGVGAAALSNIAFSSSGQSVEKNTQSTAYQCGGKRCAGLGKIIRDQHMKLQLNKRDNLEVKKYTIRPEVISNYFGGFWT